MTFSLDPEILVLNPLGVMTMREIQILILLPVIAILACMAFREIVRDISGDAAFDTVEMFAPERF